MTYILNHVVLISSTTRNIIFTVLAALIVASFVVYSKLTLKKLEEKKKALLEQNYGDQAQLEDTMKK